MSGGEIAGNFKPLGLRRPEYAEAQNIEQEAQDYLETVNSKGIEAAELDLYSPHPIVESLGKCADFVERETDKPLHKNRILLTTLGVVAVPIALGETIEHVIKPIF